MSDDKNQIISDATKFSDIKYLIDNLTEILEFIQTDEIMELRANNKEQYEQVMCSKYEEFSERHSALFNMILDDDLESMGNLIMMINTLYFVKTGQISETTAFSHIREKLSEQYIYPKFGGKKKFEKEIKRRHAKKEKTERENKEKK
jgi:hypothetical protein